MPQQCELIGVKTNLDKGFNFYGMGNGGGEKKEKKTLIKGLSSRLKYVSDEKKASMYVRAVGLKCRKIS